MLNRASVVISSRVDHFLSKDPNNLNLTTAEDPCCDVPDRHLAVTMNLILFVTVVF